MATIRPTGYLAHYGFSEEDVLEHYGVKGMKWGKHLKAKIQDNITDRYGFKRAAERSEANAKRESAMSNVQNEQYKGAKRSQAEFEKRGLFYEREGDKALRSYNSTKLNEPYINRIKDPEKRFNAQLWNGLTGAVAKSYTKYTANPGVEYNNDRMWEAWNAARDAKGKAKGHKANAEHSEKVAKSLREAYDKTVPGKVEGAYKKGKKKIKSLLSKAGKK